MSFPPFRYFPPPFLRQCYFPLSQSYFPPNRSKSPFFSGAPAAREKILFALALPLVFASLLASRLDHPVTRFGHPMTRFGHPCKRILRAEGAHEKNSGFRGEICFFTGKIARRRRARKKNSVFRSEICFFITLRKNSAPKARPKKIGSKGEITKFPIFRSDAIFPLLFSATAAIFPFFLFPPSFF